MQFLLKRNNLLQLQWVSIECWQYYLRLTRVSVIKGENPLRHVLSDLKTGSLQIAWQRKGIERKCLNFTPESSKPISYHTHLYRHPTSLGKLLFFRDLTFILIVSIQSNLLNCVPVIDQFPINSVFATVLRGVKLEDYIWIYENRMVFTCTAALLELCDCHRTIFIWRFYQGPGMMLYYIILAKTWEHRTIYWE